MVLKNDSPPREGQQGGSEGQQGFLRRPGIHGGFRLMSCTLWDLRCGLFIACTTLVPRSAELWSEYVRIRDEGRGEVKFHSGLCQRFFVQPCVVTLMLEGDLGRYFIYEKKTLTKLCQGEH